MGVNPSFARILQVSSAMPECQPHSLHVIQQRLVPDQVLQLQGDRAGQQQIVERSGQA
jgi:hypothetical protein